MSDLISREALIESVKTWDMQDLYLPTHFIDLIEAEPSVTDTNVGNKWIPIGQYPPEPSLLCFENGEMVVGYYDYDDCEWLVQCSSEYYSGLDISDDEPIAWMELPEPYKGEQHEIDRCV